MRFRFGKNWKKYVQKRFSEERVEIAKNHMLNFLNVQDLRGKYFLDIGCGSGLHSLAAVRAGASRIVSFDFDQDSVDATSILKGLADDPEHWTIMRGSILDDDFLSKLERADVVYSWGVLHHTGSMWQAFSNTVPLMNDDGILYIALYEGLPVSGRPMSFWMEVKHNYNRTGWLGKKKIEVWFFWDCLLQKRWSNLPDILRQTREYKNVRGIGRGMDMYRDVVDWVGGWPMEYASAQEVQSFAREKLSLTLVNLKTGEANAEYLFQRSSS